MNRRPLYLLAAVLALSPLQAQEPTGGMPILGDRTVELEGRIKALERRLEALEAAQGKSLKQTSVEPSDWVHEEVRAAATLMEEGKYQDALKAWQVTLEKTLAALNTEPQTLTDCFFTAYSGANGAERLVLKGERGLAKTLAQEALKALRKCQSTAPAWNPKIVKYRIERTEKLLAEMK
jgi:hypothetical protein